MRPVHVGLLIAGAIVLAAGAMVVLRERASTPLAGALPAQAPVSDARPATPALGEQPAAVRDVPRSRLDSDAHAQPDDPRMAEADQDAGVTLLEDDEQRRAASMTRAAVARALAQADRGALRMLLGAVEARADDQLLSFADTDALEAAMACLDAQEGARARALATIAARPSSFDAEVRAACAERAE